MILKTEYAAKQNTVYEPVSLSYQKVYDFTITMQSETGWS